MRAVAASLQSIVRGLQLEVREQALVDHQFAAVREQQAAAHHASLHDVLTGLPNRALFLDRLEHGISQARRHAWTLALMFIDLDDFKKINDEHGHGMGDTVLRTIAMRLKANTRMEDTVSRHGGDEFMYLASGVRDVASVAVVAGKLVRVIGMPCAVQIHGLQTVLRINASIGISLFPVDGTSADVLVKRADSAMYQAKRRRSGYAFAD